MRAMVKLVGLDEATYGGGSSIHFHIFSQKAKHFDMGMSENAGDRCVWASTTCGLVLKNIPKPYDYLSIKSNLV
jgi:hypothetical protein